MKRMPKAAFEALLGEVRTLGPDERHALCYWAALAYCRLRHGTYVYIHADPPALPGLFDVYTGRWGRSRNVYHSDVRIGYGDFARFGVERCGRIVNAAR